MQSQLLLGLLLSLIVGAVGANAAAALFKKLSLGRRGNTVAGVVGGGIGGLLLGTALGPTGVAAWLGYVLGAIAGSVVVMLSVGLVTPEK